MVSKKLKEEIQVTQRDEIAELYRASLSSEYLQKRQKTMQFINKFFKTQEQFYDVIKESGTNLEQELHIFVEETLRLKTDLLKYVDDEELGILQYEYSILELYFTLLSAIRNKDKPAIYECIRVMRVLATKFPFNNAEERTEKYILVLQSSLKALDLF